MDLKNTAKRLAPRWITRVYKQGQTYWEFLCDYKYYNLSTAWDHHQVKGNRFFDEGENLDSKLMILVHALEKAATIPQPKPQYGIEKMEQIKEILSFADCELV